MKNTYLLDSSIWISLERKVPHVVDLVTPWIKDNAICIADVIIAELLRGVATRKDYRKLAKALGDFPQLNTQWSRVAALAFEVARKGFHPPLIDLYIAHCALADRKTLVTQDTHFLHIAECTPLDVQFVA
jgi:predicted nucleic acid-binding protein